MNLTFTFLKKPGCGWLHVKPGTQDTVDTQGIMYLIINVAKALYTMSRSKSSIC